MLGQSEHFSGEATDCSNLKYEKTTSYYYSRVYKMLHHVSVDEEGGNKAFGALGGFEGQFVPICKVGRIMVIRQLWLTRRHKGKSLS